MADIRLVDVSIRDGNQSLWGAVGLNTAQILQIAPLLDRVGFSAIDYISSTAMGIAVRVNCEDPWERIRLTSKLMPDTPLQFIGTGLRFISWEAQHPDFLQLVYNCLVANGMRRFIVLDPMHDLDAMMRTADMYRKAGAADIIAALVYTISEIHDDTFYGELASKLSASPDIDRLYIKDPSGLLSAQRARSLIPVIRARIGDKPLELHSHCTIGQAPLTYMDAAELGIDALQVGCGPLGNGSSLPEAQRTVANLREMGHSVDIDDHALQRVCNYFAKLACVEGLPAGMPQEFDAAFLRHQVAGGVMSTTRRQLAEVKLGHRFDDLILEVTRVRAELGYPIMVTPFPQMVCTQALYNVIGNERYDNVADQVIRYALGKFGRPSAPIDANVLDRILSRPKAKEINNEPEPLPPAEMRKQFKARISDEEFLLRATMPADQVDAMRAAAPVTRHYNPDTQGVLKLLKGLTERPTVSQLMVEKPGYRLTLSSGLEDTH